MIAESYVTTAQQKEKTTSFNLAKVMSVAAEGHHVTLIPSFYFSYT